MGRVFTQDFWYWPAEQNRRLHVYLPNGYDESSERYPVMYFFDGHNLFFDDWATFGKSWGLKRFLDQWEKPLIVVGMECNHEGYKRLDEYCPYRCRAWGRPINGIGEQTFQWLINDVKPWADKSLRTWSHREATGIGGSSMGGIMSLYGVIAHNNVFSKAACLSPGARFYKRQLHRELLSADLSPDTRVYLSWGERES
ncbi:MAG: alpha/beta hydrolase-fold protein, partial [Coriobacteriales bacterium]|nr:alpha/beta hydrolase-fold protein [Coriobacteriales bacterium]